MCLSQLASEDLPLFEALFQDLFPNTDPQEPEDTDIMRETRALMAADKLQPLPSLVSKVVQLNDTRGTRHGNMLVGASCSGKSTVWKLLQRALSTGGHKGERTDTRLYVQAAHVCSDADTRSGIQRALYTDMYRLSHTLNALENKRVRGRGSKQSSADSLAGGL